MRGGKQRVDHLFIVLVALGLHGLSERRHESVDEDARSGGGLVAHAARLVPAWGAGPGPCRRRVVLRL